MQPGVGQMRDRVTIQIETPAPDSAGGAVTTWVDKATKWANIAPISSSTRIQALAQALSITHKITMRYVDYLAMPDDHRYRLVWNRAEMRILGVTNPDQVKRYIEITCQMGQMVGE